MYKKKPRSEATCVRPRVPIAHCCCILFALLVLLLIVFVDFADETRELPALLPPYAGPRVFSGPAQPSLTSGRPYALRSLGMSVCNRQSRFRRQACWMCPAWGPHDEAQAMAGGDMLYLLPSVIGGFG